MSKESITVVAKDNFTPSINTMKSACLSFEKELNDMQTKLNTLNKTKVSLKIDTSSAISELKKTEKQLSKTDEAAGKLNKGLNQSYDGCVKDLKNITSEAKNAEKALKSLNTTSSKSKSKSKSASSSGGSSESGSSSTKSDIKSAAADIGGLVGDAVSQIGTSHFGSKYGQEAGTIASGALSGAAMGASIGAMAGPVGALIGGGLGAVVGIIKGVSENNEKKDEAFKEYYSNLFNTVEQQRKDSLANGTSIAAEREFSAATNIGLEISSGSLTTDALESMRQSGIDVYAALSKLPECMGKTNDEIRDMVANGLIPGADAAQAISDNTYQGLANQLNAAKDNLDAVKGKAYNDALKPEIQYGIDSYEGEYSDEMALASEDEGIYEASLEGKKQRLATDARVSLFSGEVQGDYQDTEQGAALQQLIDKYQQAQKEFEAAELIGDEEGMLAARASRSNAVEAADALAITTYDASPEAQIENDRRTALSESIKNIAGLDDECWEAGYELANKFTEGLKSVSGDISVTVTSSKSKQEAFGLSYVPYNGYPATLHEGERVLTASENRSYGKGTASVVISGNSFVIREEADIERVARTLVSKINQACTIAV